MATTALQVEWDNAPLHIEKMQAPEVSNVIWSNLGVGLWRRYFFFADKDFLHLLLTGHVDLVLAQMKEN